MVVDLWAPLRGPYRQLAPILEGLEQERADEFDLVKINIDENPQVVAALGAQSILLVIGFHNGEAVPRFLGVPPAGMIRGFLDELVPSQLEQYVVSAGQELEADELDDCQSLLAQAELIDTEHEAVRFCRAGLLIARQQPDAAIKVLSSIPSNGHNGVARLLSRARLMSAADSDIQELEDAGDQDDLDSLIAYGLRRQRRP